MPQVRMLLRDSKYVHIQQLNIDKKTKTDVKTVYINEESTLQANHRQGIISCVILSASVQSISVRYPND